MRLIVTRNVQEIQRNPVAVATESIFSYTHHPFKPILEKDGPLLDAIRSSRVIL